MLSRVADSLYWMARYIERAEHTARIIGVQLNLILDQTSLSPEDRWKQILESLGDPELPNGPRDPGSLTHALLWDSACGASITSSVYHARENCRQVRNQISSEMWEQLNRLYHMVRRQSADPRHSIPLEFLLSVDEGVHLFHGITDSSMSHNEAWQFIQIGRFLERATNTSTLLDVHFRHPSHRHLEWIGLLRSCTAFEAYCRARTADVRPDWALEFLLLDDSFPHSVRFSVDRVRAALATLEGPGDLGERLGRIVGRLQASLRFIDIDEVMASGVRQKLQEIQHQCEQIHVAVQHTYIDYSIEEALGA
jgi:uncharacterized alpha-E superfamily protein